MKIFKNTSRITVRSKSRKSLEIQASGPDMVRVTLNPGKGKKTVPFALERPHPDPKSWETVREDRQGNTVLEQKHMKTIIHKNSLSISFKNNSGKIIAQDHPRTPYLKNTHRQVINNTHRFYGFGERTGTFNKYGYRFESWCTDNPYHTPGSDPLYQAIPFYIGINDNNEAYGYFYNNTFRISFDMGFSSPEESLVSLHGGRMDYYFIYGPTVREVVQKFTRLTGKTFFPPKWAFGYQQCRYSYYPSDMLLGIAKEFRKQKIPCDVLYMDIDYMKGFRIFTACPKGYKNLSGITKKLSRDGFKVITINDPGIKVDDDYTLYREGKKKGLFVKRPSGKNYVGKVWPGKVVFPDFTNEEAQKWWAEKHRFFVKNGIAGVWNDMNEPADFATITKTIPENAVHKAGRHKEIHNIYGALMTRSTHEGLRRLRPGKRPMVISRAGYAGIQRYAAVWHGDNHSWWEHLRHNIHNMFSLGLSGVAFNGADCGGFSWDCTPELLIRWTQLGVFNPFFRNHSNCDTRPQEPFAFDEKTTRLCRKFIELRYTLLPYIYSQFYNCVRTGEPLVRPLFYDYQDNPQAYLENGEFLFGDSILVAPVLDYGARSRSVYLPEGNWYEMETGKKLKGGREQIVQAPLDHIPVYVKENSIIPFQKVIQHTGETVDKIDFHIFGLTRKATCELYEDDGDSLDYKDGHYCITHISAETGKKQVQVKIHNSGEFKGNYKKARLVFPGNPHILIPEKYKKTFNIKKL